MALQDLTPQLRTRLGRVERVVGFFVLFATLLLLAGFAYYIYATAQRKGWFLTKVTYQTSINNAAGLKEGDPVKLMGFTVGELTKVEPNAPGEYYNVTVYFNIRSPNYGYIWSDSRVKVASADFLGNRYLEVIKGIDGIATIYETNKVTSILNQKLVRQELTQLEKTHKDGGLAAGEAIAKAREDMKARVSSNPEKYYADHKKAPLYWVTPIESPALTDRLEEVVNVVTNALPNVFYLTNQIALVLSNIADATHQLDEVLLTSKPLLENVGDITGNLKDPEGSLGRWLIPTNLNAQLNQTLASTDNTLESVQTNLVVLVRGIDQTLLNLASITSNLNMQVEANPTLVSNISSTIVNANDMVQGLKRHWLLRSAFKTNKTQSVRDPSTRSQSRGTPRNSK